MKTEEPVKDSKGSAILAMALVVLILVLIIPFPKIVMDILIAANLILAALMLSAVIFNGKQRRRRIFLREKNGPFCFPEAFLLCTLFMAAVNIASGRSILTRGAEFDNYIIGFIAGLISRAGTAGTIAGFACFIIILCIFTVFIMKSSIRVAEIAARFSLDVMPGNIITFEVLYHCGKINEEKLISEKNNLRKQADFLNAIDGVFKFIAWGIKITIYITTLIVLGGIITGINFRGQTFQEAEITYMSFAVGHGFVCLLPLLLLSIAAGIASARSS